MNSRLIVSAIAAATLCASALPAAAQGRVYDRNASNNPEIYQQTHPEDAHNAQNLQGPAAPRVERHEPRREAGRRDGARQEQARRDEQHRREADHRRHQHDRRDWDHHRGHDRRHYGYVVPRPIYYYSPPAVYYSAPPVYYGAAPQTYYPPAYGSAQLVFQTGDYLPPQYRAAQYVVTDWQWRGLSAPPYGYQWIVLGPDHFALVADSTGQIVSLVAAR